MFRSSAQEESDLRSVTSDELDSVCECYGLNRFFQYGLLSMLKTSILKGLVNSGLSQKGNTFCGWQSSVMLLMLMQGIFESISLWYALQTVAQALVLFTSCRSHRCLSCGARMAVSHRMSAS